MPLATSPARLLAPAGRNGPELLFCGVLLGLAGAAKPLKDVAGFALHQPALPLTDGNDLRRSRIASGGWGQWPPPPEAS